MTAAAETPPSIADRPLRLAMFAPVPPIPSGISAYLADLVPLLPAAWNIEVFTDEGLEGRGTGERTHRLQRSSGAAVDRHAHSDFVARQRDQPFDLNVYQVGNTASRVWMLDYVLAHPGLLVLHDGVVHPARVGAATAAGDIAGYRRAVTRCRPDAGNAIGHLVAGGLGGPALYRTFPMCEDLVRASRATAMHGELACRWLAALVPEATVVSLAHWRSVAFDSKRRLAWRDRLSGGGEVLIGSFGNIGPERRLNRVIEALAAIDRAKPWRLVVAGSVASGLALAELAAARGIADRITWLHGLDDADFVALMAAADLAVNLRYPPARSSSGVLHQLLQLGVPVIISDVLHWRDYPDTAVQRVPPGPDASEREALGAALRRWIDDAGSRGRAGAAARGWAGRHLTADAMRASYELAISTALEVQ